MTDFGNLLGQHLTEIVIILMTAFVVGPWLGFNMGRLFDRRPFAPRDRLIKIERAILKIVGVDPSREMSPASYIRAILALHLIGVGLLMLILLFQNILPLNPMGLKGVSPLMALTIAISFVTNTNLQTYAGEVLLSPLSQMLGLGVQNFVSCGLSLAIMVALARGLVRKQYPTLGNLWVDLVRACVFFLLPLSFICALILGQQGVPQSWGETKTITSLEGASQQVSVGPVASQIAIKQIGSNGGGYYNSNSAHPLENPTFLTNFVEVLMILLIPLSCLFAFGYLIRDHRHAWALVGASSVIFFIVFSAALWFQLGTNATLDGLSFWEGIESRLGPIMSTFWAVATTTTSNGSVIAAHSSLAPMAGGVATFNMLMGEVVFGGVGCGVYGLVLFSVLTIFIAGLMVGRTPEYLGKKVTGPEVIWAATGVLVPGIAILFVTGIVMVLPAGIQALGHDGPHGLTEVLYAFASAVGNNGSSFGSLAADQPFYLGTLSFLMLLGRLGVMIPVIMLAGKFAVSNTTPPSLGTFPTDSVVFSLLLVGIILMFEALTFFPVLVLGPLLEHFLMLKGVSF